ncbi:MAG: hypothetical protein ACJAVV_001856 [Alphaproteobacteria bacterium]|jgi:hypothetical protein
MKLFVSRKLAPVNKLSGFQHLVEPYMQRMIKNTTTGLTVSGLTGLDMSKPCLFVSNHRDIALDPAFVNWVLHINGQDTVRIAVGDNLFGKSWVADLLRLNKCFVVERSFKGRRDKLNAAKLLSEYIQYSLQIDKQHLWIAQREGRAKDGIDKTNPAIISMLTLHKPKNVAFSEYVNELRIVPVSISYEFDPCDTSKAKELQQSEDNGEYEKPDNEDMRSIVDGITGEKGNIHVHFGKLVGSQFSNAKEVATFIDGQILDGFCIFATSQVAFDILNAKQTNTEITTNSAGDTYDEVHQAAYQYLVDKLATLNESEQHKLLLMYANPLLRKQQVNI